MSIQLTSDVEAELLAAAEARGVSVDVIVAEALDLYLANRPAGSGARTVPAQDRTAEMRWAEQPVAEYRGTWVVLEGSKVMASGPDPSAIYEQARKSGIYSPFLIYVPREEPEFFAGGWLD
ncbi:MAG TPA: DUF5678 domain-containing protein [Bryobacteraceae bacterium]|jgi:hypothetical protein